MHNDYNLFFYHNRISIFQMMMNDINTNICSIRIGVIVICLVEYNIAFIKIIKKKKLSQYND